MENLTHEQPLSNNPEENLRLENEFLQLKIQAELGAETEISGNTPAEVTNKFLKNVLAFEKEYAKASPMIIKNLIAPFQASPIEELSDSQMKSHLDKLELALFEKQIIVDYIGEYEDREKYRFITEELLETEIFNVGIPGFFVHYIYEEFHPNHALDIENRTKELISSWCDHDLNEHKWTLDEFVILPGGKTLSKSQAIQQLKAMFNCYSNFRECRYTIDKLDYEYDETTESGHGKVTGNVEYIAVAIEQKETRLSGPYIVNLNCQYGWWTINYFSLPGFDFR